MAATQVGSVTSAGDDGDPGTVARPTGVVDGHLVVAIGWNDTGDPAGSAQLEPGDTGWTLVGELEVSGKGNGYVWMRRTAGPTAYAFAPTDYSTWTVHVSAWSGVPSGAVLVASFVQSSSNGTGVQAPSIASGGYTGTDPLLLTGHYALTEGTARTWTSTTPTGMSVRGPAVQPTPGRWAASWFAALQLSGKVATTARSATLSGSEPWMAVAVAIPTAGVSNSISGSASAPLGGMSATAAGTPWLPTEALTDDFDDNTVDTTKWPASFGSVSETGGQARVPAAASGSVANGYGSAARYSLVGSEVLAQVTPPSLDASTYAWSSLTLYGDAPTYNDFVRVFVNHAAGGGLEVDGAVVIDSVTVFSATAVPIGAVTSTWLRLREVGGTVYGDYSTDGRTWTNAWSTTLPPELAGKTLELDLESNRSATTGDGTAGRFDNLNLPPAFSSIDGSAAAAFGALTASAAGTRTDDGAAAAAALGGLQGASAGTRTLQATAAAPLGPLAAAAAGAVAHGAAATAPLGSLTAGAAGEVEHEGSAAAALGGLLAAAAATTLATGSAAAPLGALTAAAEGTVTTPVPDPEPIAAYSFDEAGTTVVDATGNGHHFALGANLTRTVDGHTAGGLTTLADGVITEMANPAFGQTADRTVMMWARGSGVVWYIRWQVVSIDSGAWGILRLGDEIGVQLRDEAGFQRFMATAPTDGEWHHYAATYNGTTGDAAFYLDGVSAASGTFAGPLRTDADRIDLAEFDPDTTIDDLRIYDEALTAEQVATAAATPVPAPSTATADAPLAGLTAAAAATVGHPASASGQLGGLVAAAAGALEHPAAADGPLGDLVAAAAGTVLAAAAAAASLGGLAGAAASVTEQQAVAAGALGALTAAAAGDVDVAAAAGASLGVLTSTAAGDVEHEAAADGPLGSLVAAAAGATAHGATAAAGLGALAAAATSEPRGTAAAGLGELAAAAGGTVVVPATAQADLGGLASAATAVIAVPAAATAALGGLAAAADAAVGVPGTATAPLGALESSAQGETTGAGSGAAAAALGQMAASAAGDRASTATASAALGALSSAAAARHEVDGLAVAGLGGLTAVAAAQRRIPAAAAADLDALQAAAEGAAVSIVSAAAPLGGLDADAAAALDVVGSALAHLGPLVAAASGVRHVGASAEAGLGALVAIGTARAPVLLGDMTPIYLRRPDAHPTASSAPRMTSTAGTAARMTGG